MANPKFIAAVDHMEHPGDFDYVDLKAKTLLEAIGESNKLFNEKVRDIEICERRGKQRKSDTGAKVQQYTKVLESFGGPKLWRIPTIGWYMEKRCFNGLTDYEWYMW